MTSKMFIAGTALCVMVLTGCQATKQVVQDASQTMSRMTAYAAPTAPVDHSFGAVPVTAYDALADGDFTLPPIPASKMDPQFLRQRVVYDSGEYEAGTVVVDTAHRFLYVVERGGTAMRYGIGVGKAGFSWAGEARIGDKQHWPKWFPPVEMIDRRADLEQYRDGQGMEPGLMNPLGARALYLYQGNKDTLYRLHGTPEWRSIGTAASSGCIRLMNQDIIDLYDRVPLDARVVVLQGRERMVEQAPEPKPTKKSRVAAR